VLPEQWERVKEAFDAIVDLDAAGRTTALSELRLQDPELHAAVEELVANHDRAGDFLTEPMALELVPTLTVGEIIAGRYEIVRFIGRGGMGEVYEAQDNQLGERVALKTIGPDIALDDRYVARFVREVKLARNVTNKHVCRVHDVGQQDGSTRRISFLTMELIEGETLAARLRRCHHLPAAEAFPLIEQMAEALSAAHEEKIIHRDFKPANIMLTLENGYTPWWSRTSAWHAARLPLRACNQDSRVSPRGPPAILRPNCSTRGRGRQSPPTFTRSAWSSGRC